MNAYTITRAEISLAAGVKVVADVGSVEDINKLLADLKAAGLGGPVAEKLEDVRPSGQADTEEPSRKIETQAGLEEGRLQSAKILAIKDGVPQFLQKNVFSTFTDAVLVLMYALEVGLKQNPVAYDDFSSLFESQNLKASSPLSMLVTNLRNASYLDSRAYSDGRKLRLTAKGEAKAVEVLKKLTTRSGS